MSDARRPLERFSVVDLTTVRSGPTGTKILAAFGADGLRVGIQEHSRGGT